MSLSRNYIISKLKALRPEIAERYGVEIFGLVGSWARDEAKPGSDIDVVYRILDKKKFSSVSWSIGALWNEFQDKFDCDVDVIDWDALNPRHRRVMQKELVKFYG